MELPGYYFDEEKRKYFPITQQYLNSKNVTKQKAERNVLMNEVKQARINNYNKSKIVYADILTRAFSFNKIDKKIDSNLNHCINDNLMLKAKAKSLNPAIKTKVVLPAHLRDLEAEFKITILKHNQHQIVYYTLDAERKCYRYKQAIVDGKIDKSDILNGSEIARDLNNDLKSHPLGCDNAYVHFLDGSTFFSFGYEQSGQLTHQPTMYRFLKSTGPVLDERSYKFEVPVPVKGSIRSAIASLNYVAVASDNDILIHHWMANQQAVFRYTFKVQSNKRRRGQGQPSASSNIMSIIFTRRGKEELHKLSGYLFVGFRNGKVTAIPIEENSIGFDKRFNVPLPASVKSIVSLEEGYDSGLLISAISNNPNDKQLLLYIPKLSHKNLKRLKIVRLNTKYSSVTSSTQICMFTKNKKFLCYGRKGELYDEKNYGGFDIFLLDSLELKAKNTTDGYSEIYPVRTMDDYVRDDVKDSKCKLREVNAIDNVHTKFTNYDRKDYDINLEYEAPRNEQALSDGSRISMLFQFDSFVDLTVRDESYMVISVNLA